MELQFVGDIKAVRAGDKFRATGKLQSRRTGNYIEVSTEIDIPSMMAEARSVYNAARSYLSSVGKEIEALPTPEGGLYGSFDASSMALPTNAVSLQAFDSYGGAENPVDAMVYLGRKVTLAKAQARRAQGKSLNSGELALLSEHDRSQSQSKRGTETQRSTTTKLTKQLADEKKKQIVQAQMRATANKNLSERRVERAGYEEKLKGLRDQIAASQADATRQAELSAQAAQFEARMAQMDEASAQMQAQYENQLAMVQAMPAAQVAALPQAAAISQVVDAQVESDEAMQGMGASWGWLKNVAKKFKKALAVVFRSKIVKGLVKSAATMYGGPAGAKLADAAFKAGKGKVKPSWKVPGLGVTAENARTWIRLLESAKAGDANSTKILNRIKVMARLKHPQAAKTFWLLRDVERLLPEVRASLARGDANVTEDQSMSDTEPKAVPNAMVGLQLLGMGAAESQTPVKIRCLDFNPLLGWTQIPFSAAMGKKKKKPNAKQIAALRAKAAIARARQQRQQQARNAPTATVAPEPGTIPASSDPYYGQPSGSQPGYPPGYGPADQGYDPYDQGYDQYQPANYGVPAPVDPYAAAYAATPPNYDPYAQTYAAQAQAYGPYATQAQAYGDYSAAQNQPNFDPYNPASYGY